MTGLALHCETLEGPAGHEPPLIILHGLFGSGGNWRGIARKLAESRTVALVDARNHGRSPHDSLMSYELMASDVAALMTRLEWRQIDLLGHSMGGKTAMAMALSTPERIARLIVADIAPVRYDHDFADVFRALKGLDLARLTRRAEADAALAEHIEDPPMRAFLLHNLTQVEGTFRWRINLPGIEQNLDRLVDFPSLSGPSAASSPGSFPGSFSEPTLFLRGGRSDYLLDDHWPGTLARFPRAELDTVAGAGHWLHAEQPAAFTERVLAFLDRTGHVQGPDAR